MIPIKNQMSELEVRTIWFWQTFAALSFI